MQTSLFINVTKVYSNYNESIAIEMLLNKEGGDGASGAY